MSDDRGTVFVVDDDPSVRRGLVRLLKAAGFDSVAFDTADAFRQAVAPERAGCALLDVQMPGTDGMSLHRQLRDGGYTMPIIFLTGHGTIPMSVQAMKDGAMDFLTKPVDDTALLAAVRRALQRDRDGRADHQEAAETRRRATTLTPREHEIMRFILTGRLNKQIGYALGISEKTVKVHRARVMEKMGVESVAELVRLTEKAGIEPAPEPGPP